MLSSPQQPDVERVLSVLCVCFAHAQPGEGPGIVLTPGAPGGTRGSPLLPIPVGNAALGPDSEIKQVPGPNYVPCSSGSPTKVPLATNKFGILSSDFLFEASAGIGAFGARWLGYQQ